MENLSETNTPVESSVSRRELLKVLAASGGGLIAAAFLPKRWLKPVIEAGVLPAHAQATLGLRIEDFELSYVENPKGREIGGCATDINQYAGSLLLTDALGQINHPYEPWFAATASGINFWSASAQDGNRWSTPYAFSFQACCNSVFTLYALLDDRRSNTISETLECDGSG